MYNSTCARRIWALIDSVKCDRAFAAYSLHLSMYFMDIIVQRIVLYQNEVLNYVINVFEAQSIEQLMGSRERYVAEICSGSM